ncbi:hypothetical protein PA25_21910 [Pseudoalteromonas sp. A25]|uniref:hypothetical protein n=1 Tax=Pseudoalteromonas sp. A25 TaxID=116092 RepID=UPI0012610E70|nr:hypothetical protein [Pseudoalteromonas sp. A25]BBN82206.1 hypothetical protein PA25_21910 [Pseudoalteromonas sp. A25]
MSYIPKWLLLPLLVSTEFPNSFSMAMNQLEKYVAIYQLDDTHEIKTYLRNDKLFSRQLGSFIFELTPKSETEFDFHTWI